MEFCAQISHASLLYHILKLQVESVRVKLKFISADQQHIVGSFFALLAKVVSEDLFNHE